MPGIRVFVLLLPFAIYNTTLRSLVQITHCQFKQRSLTCYFSEDLSRTKSGFALSYRSSIRDEFPLACVWDKGKPLCDVSEGFEAPVTVSYEFTVKVPADAVGLFTCSKIPPDNIMGSIPCFVSAKAQGNLISTSSASPTIDPSSPESSREQSTIGGTMLYTIGGMSTPDNVSHKPPTGDTTNNYLLAALVVISTMFVLMLLGTAVYAIILRSRKRKKGLQNEEDSDSPLRNIDTEEQGYHYDQ